MEWYTDSIGERGIKDGESFLSLAMIMRRNECKCDPCQKSCEEMQKEWDRRLKIISDIEKNKDL